ncbi:hypothetical protein VPNG_09319 [Cytospora leucostoma]|uniref:Efflux pump dotC n=1 Tax=Cytospora leucostoma TaxID=1230097 RepID=A0A423VUY1_9PEZI|nr:hypothetical protein VPNG_09319 [Cytospora leucostoma]
MAWHIKGGAKSPSTTVVETGASNSSASSQNAETSAAIVENTPQQIPDTSTAAAAVGQNGTAGEPTGRTRLQTVLIMVALSSAVFLSALDVTIVTVAVPTISHAFNSTAGYTWIGSAYLLANCATAPSWAKLSDIWGRKPIMMTAVGTFWIGSLLAGLSANMGMLIAARAIQGIGGGGIMNLCSICISDLFSMRERGLYLGIISLVWAFAGGFGPVIGGFLTTRTTWRWCFYLNLPIAAIAMTLLYFNLHLHNPRTSIRQGLAAVDWVGSFLIISATLMILLGIEFGGITFPWSSPTIICLLVFGVVTAGLAALYELYVAKLPIIPLRIFKQPCNLAVLGLCFSQGCVYISASYYLPLYFQAVIGATPLMSGIYVLPYTFVLGMTSAVSGFTIKKTGRYLPSIIGGNILMTLGYALMLDLDLYLNWWKIVVFQLILGIGVGPGFQAPLVALHSTVKPAEIAGATATYGFTRQLSTSMSVVIGGVIFQNGMQSQHAALVRELGEEVADLLTGANAASSVTTVAGLPDAQRAIAQGAYFTSLRAMFLFYVAIASLGIFFSFFVGHRNLATHHTEHRTGLASQEPERAPVADEEEPATNGSTERTPLLAGDNNDRSSRA